MEATDAVDAAAGAEDDASEAIDVRPVAGSAQPLHGLSGILRRVAYVLPEHRARHWMLLMLADRVDVTEGRMGDLLARPLLGLGLHRQARSVRRNPLPAVVAAGLAFLAVRRGRRRRRR